MRVGVHTLGWCKIGAPFLLEICRCVWIRPCTFSFPSAQPLPFRHSTVCALRCMWGEDAKFWRSPLPARASCSLHPSIFPSPGSLPSALLCVIQPWHTPCSMALHSTNTHAHARRARRGTFLPLGPSPPPFWGRAGSQAAWFSPPFPFPFDWTREPGSKGRRSGSVRFILGDRLGPSFAFRLVGRIRRFGTVRKDAPCDAQVGRRRGRKRHGRCPGASWIQEPSHVKDCPETHEWWSIIPRKGCSSSATYTAGSTSTVHLEHP